MTGRQAPLLSVRDLRVVFPTPIGMVHAVDGVSFDLEAGQSMGIVGESGSGKTVTAKTLMNLLPSYALVDGSVNFDGQDLRALGAGRKAEKHLWGVEISMVFQDPMTSLNPVKKVGEQIAESLRYPRADQNGSPPPGRRPPRAGGDSRTGKKDRRIPPPTIRRPPPAGGDRSSPGVRTTGTHRR